MIHFPGVIFFLPCDSFHMIHFSHDFFSQDMFFLFFLFFFYKMYLFTRQIFPHDFYFHISFTLDYFNFMCYSSQINNIFSHFYKWFILFTCNFYTWLLCFQRPHTVLLTSAWSHVWHFSVKWPSTCDHIWIACDLLFLFYNVVHMWIITFLHTALTDLRSKQQAKAGSI